MALGLGDLRHRGWRRPEPWRIEPLRWLADLAGMPEGAGGVFLSGATIANLNALAAARAWWRATHSDSEGRLGVAMTAEAHASAKMVARALELEIVPVEGGERAG